MLGHETLRTYQVMIDGQWVDAYVGQLDVGDHARGCEPDGTPLGEFMVLSRPAFEIEFIKKKDCA